LWPFLQHGVHINAQTACIDATDFSQVIATASLFYIANIASTQTDGILITARSNIGPVVRGVLVHGVGSRTGCNSTAVRIVGTGTATKGSIDVVADNMNTGVNCTAAMGA
jgi:hypothetical protein